MNFFDTPKLTDWGEVTATSPLTVRVNGSDDGVAGFIASNEVGTLVNGDKVLLVRFGSRWFVVGTYP